MTSGRAYRVSWGLSAHARRLLTFALAGLAVAVISGRPVFAGAAAPAILLLAGWRDTRPGEVTVDAQVTSRQLVESQQSMVTAEVRGTGDYAMRATLCTTDAFSAAITGQQRAMQRRAGDGVLRVPFRSERWGIWPLGTLEIVLRDRLRLVEGHAMVRLPEVSTHPLPAELRSRVVISRLPSRLGEHPSRAAGEGMEFAGVREFVPGDRQRRINWPATTRSGTIQLNTFAAQRTQNVVVLADATTNVGEPGATSLDLVFRAAAGTVSSYLAAGDRVGVIVYAGRLSWIGPGLGRRHFHRLMDLLVSGQRGWDDGAGLTRLPKAALPPGALVVAFSPLLDSRLVTALRDLRERGFSVLVVDVLTAEPPASRQRTTQLAQRIWRLEQQAIRFSLTQLAIPVVHWDGKQSLDEPLAPYTRRVMLAGRA